MLKWLPLSLGVLFAASGLVLLSIPWIESQQTQQVGALGPNTVPAKAPTATATVYYSRSDRW